MMNKTASEQLLKRLDQLSWGSLTLTTPDGKVRTFAGQERVDHHANLVVHDWGVITNLIRKGDIGFADDYRAGKWDTDDINQLVQVGLKNQTAMQDMVAGNKLYSMLSSLFYLFRLNTIKGSKKISMRIMI